MPQPIPLPAPHASRPPTQPDGGDRYVGWEVIGRGGAATVYRVADRELGVPLAIKILEQRFRRDPRQLASLRREVLVSRALRHPNICPVHDLYEGPMGVGVIMDLLEGQDLKHWIADNQRRLRDTLGERLELLRRVAAALTVAHTRIVHRDLKPANVFLRGKDPRHPLIMDFGLSVLGADGGLSGGTPRYMAPEQFTSPGTSDVRVDLFSFGVMAYELLTAGRLPASSLTDVLKTGQVPQVAAADIERPSRFCPQIPDGLDLLVQQLCDSDPQRRPQTAAEVLAVLEGLTLREETPLATAPGRRPRRDCVAIPAGRYKVGTPAHLPGPATEKPQREVRLSALWLDRRPVTNRQFRAFLVATGRTPPDLLDDPVFGAPDLPVVMVSWAEAQAYAAWVGGRLPREAEWEVAARSGDPEREFPWGPAGSFAPTRANLDHVAERPSPVGAHPAGRTAWGLDDMGGNVWEWCADGWRADAWRQLPALADDPETPPEGLERVIRGGSFDSPVATARCAFRHKAPADDSRADIGFRVAYDEPPKPD